MLAAGARHALRVSPKLVLSSRAALLRAAACPPALSQLPRAMASSSSAAAAKPAFRVESDTMGKIEVSNSVYWGAQTQRSLENFKIGGPAARMPIEIIRGECRPDRLTGRPGGCRCVEAI